MPEYSKQQAILVLRRSLRSGASQTLVTQLTRLRTAKTGSDTEAASEEIEQLVRALKRAATSMGVKVRMLRAGLEMLEADDIRELISSAGRLPRKSKVSSISLGMPEKYAIDLPGSEEKCIDEGFHWFAGFTSLTSVHSDLEVIFDDDVPADDIRFVVTKLAELYEACGGLGFKIKFDEEEARAFAEEVH
jgi:hypothetical protein